MAGNYWAKFARNRVSRRHAILATGGAAAAAAFLAACGGDDDSNGGSSGSGSSGSSGSGSSSGGGTSGGAAQSGLLTTPTDDSGDRKRGGEINTPILNIGTATLEQSLGGNGAGSPLVHLAHSQLMRAKIGTFNDTPQGDWEPEFAESYEQSADGLQVTFKLRGMKFDDRPPTNGRVSTAEDVVYSWERFEATNPRAPELANSKAADAPVISVEAIDDQTVRWNLAFPMAPFFAYLGSSFFPFIYPKEADGGYETKSIARGTGPWRIPDDRPTGDAFLERNPYYDRDGEPFADKLNIYDIKDPATIFAQLSAGALDFTTFSTQPVQEDVLSLKKNNPDMILYQRPYFAKGCGAIFFGRLPDSPWNDDRVRKAMAMNMDADLWGDNASNRKKFEDEGLPVEVADFARAGPGYDWWLDPKTDALGDAGKYLKYNPEEAHKMLEATGLELPIKSTYHFVPNPARDPLYDAMLGIYQSSGDFEFAYESHPDFNLYLTEIRNTGGNFDGFSISFYFDHHDYDWTMYLMYNRESTDFWLGKEREDPKQTELVNAQRRELDPERRKEIFQEFVKYDIGQMYYLPYHFPQDWKPYAIGRPTVGSWGWWQMYIEQYPTGAGQLLSQLWKKA
jgi:peptide/nickel transport system substrate-binding protein